MNMTRVIKQQFYYVSCSFRESENCQIWFSFVARLCQNNDNEFMWKVEHRKKKFLFVLKS